MKRQSYCHFSPAAIETPIFATIGFTPEMKDAMASQYPAGRIGRVNETTAAILFAASEGASFISGSNILVDGGLMAGNAAKEIKLN